VPVSRFIAVSAEATAPTGGEIENCTRNETLFAAKLKGNWLNFECILAVSKSHFFGNLQKARSSVPRFQRQEFKQGRQALAARNTGNISGT